MQRLKDRIEQLEELLGVDCNLTSQLREAFGIEPDEAQILGMLYRRDFVSRAGLYDALYGALPESEWPLEKQLDVKISKLRKQLVPHSVNFETRWGEGWTMPRQDKAKVAARIHKKIMHADASGLARLRWKNTTAAERSEFARRVANVRWKKIMHADAS